VSGLQFTRRLGLILCALLLVVALLSVAPVRQRLLRAAGWALVSEDPLGHADIIFLANEAVGSGTLEAADMVREGLAPRVAVFLQEAPSRARSELLRRGVTPLDQAEVAVRELHELGVHDVERVPRYVLGTQDESKVLQTWCNSHGIRTLMVITSSDHSRRTRRSMRRAMRGTAIHAIVRYSRYSGFQPDSWWRSRSGERTEVVELEKLLLDVLLHPFS
jgi:hypothetical protein